MLLRDVRVGMHLRAVGITTVFTPIIVTALIENGFEFTLNTPIPLLSRDGVGFPISGHKHFGTNGTTYYEVVPRKNIVGMSASDVDQTLIDIATRAARIIKICRLTGNNLQDDVSVRLNARPTHEEIKQARMWQLALELASVEESDFIQARILRQKSR